MAFYDPLSFICSPPWRAGLHFLILSFQRHQLLLLKIEEQAHTGGKSNKTTHHGGILHFYLFNVCLKWKLKNRKKILGFISESVYFKLNQNIKNTETAILYRSYIFLSDSAVHYIFHFSVLQFFLQSVQAVSAVDRII